MVKPMRMQACCKIRRRIEHRFKPQAVANQFFRIAVTRQILGEDEASSIVKLAPPDQWHRGDPFGLQITDPAILHRPASTFQTAA